MVRMVEPEVARASIALWASAASSGAPKPTRARRPRSVSSSEPRDRQSAEFESHEASGVPKLLTLVTENQQFHKFIIITMKLPFTHDSAIRWEEVLGVL